MTTAPKLRSQYIETITHFMIAYGGVSNPQDDGFSRYKGMVNYYGGQVNCSRDKTEEAIKDFKIHGINYAESSDPASHSAPYFAGTFTSNQYNLEYLQSTIVSNSGQIYTFLLSLNDIEFGSLVSFIAKYDLLFDWACQKVEQRIIKSNEFDSPSHDFGYVCQVNNLSLD